MWTTTHRHVGLAAVAIGLGLASPTWADTEYLIGPEDVLSITVWERPELSRTVVVRSDGNITVPPVGDVLASGKTTATLARDLESRFYNVLRITTQATISVIAFNSRQVYLAGQVSNPGRYSFEQIPGLIDLLGGAGGLNATADLANVRILRKSEGAPQTLTVDVSRAVQTGDLTNVPALEPGDVVFVPGSVGTAGQVVGGGGVFILGEVARPGVYNLLPGMDLLQLLSLAGGTTPAADLTRIDVLGSDAGGAFRVRVNLRDELQGGRRGPEVRSGDTVVVTGRQAGPGRMAWGMVRETLGFSRDVLNLLLIDDALSN